MKHISKIAAVFAAVIFAMAFVGCAVGQHL